MDRRRALRAELATHLIVSVLILAVSSMDQIVPCGVLGFKPEPKIYLPGGWGGNPNPWPRTDRVDMKTHVNKKPTEAFRVESAFSLASANTGLKMSGYRTASERIRERRNRLLRRSRRRRMEE